MVLLWCTDPFLLNGQRPHSTIYVEYIAKKIYRYFIMPVSDITAPALSTHQDEEAFSYAKVDHTLLDRAHLHLVGDEDPTEKLNQYYDIDLLETFLSQKSGDELRYKRVTLQFPDKLICDSAAVAQGLQKRLGLNISHLSKVDTDSPITNAPDCESSTCCKNGNQCKSGNNADVDQRLWILADTSYSSCCVDEVAAEHVKADLLVHFGDACLNPVASLHSAYVFGTPYVDVDSLVISFKERYPIDEFSESKIVLMADSPHTYILKNICDRLADYKGITYADIYLDDPNACIIGYQPEETQNDLKILNRAFKGLDEESLSECELFHITTPEAPRLLQLTTKFLLVTTFDPETNTVSQGPYPNLMRRYRYMHMARTAGTVGILVNTLSLANTKALVNAVGLKVKEAGKKHYIFVVGKPNVAKLANFDAIDMWCILGCDHQGIIIDETNEYYKPIVTPYELLLALSDELSWTGQWVTDFNKLLANMEEEEEQKSEDLDKDEDAPEFNPVIGKYVSTSRPLRQLQHLQISQEESEPESSNALVKKLSTTIAIRGTVSTSAAHLQTREWKGLGSDWTNDEDSEGALVEDGRSGVARGYDFDVENGNKRSQ